MSLPIINHPAVLIEIPSLKKKFRFRPFTVAEERILLLGGNSGKSSPVLNIKQIINNCSLDSVDIDALAVFDVEYLFIKLRSVSVSNILDLTVNDEPVQVNLDDVKVHYPDTMPDNKLVLDEKEQLGVMLQYPRFKDTSEDESIVDTDRASLLKIVIKAVFKGDEVFDLDEYTIEDVDKFISNFSSKQVNKIVEWANQIPYVYLDVPLKNGTVRRLRGIQSFFG